MPFRTALPGLIEGFGRDHCVLCDTSLATVLAQVPCPHWFITPGSRGFRIARLLPVFEVFDVGAVIEYLRIFASADRQHEGAACHEERVDGGSRIAITWRRRGWLFEPAGPGEPDEAFVLTMLLDGKVMERARIALCPRERTVVMTMLDSRRGDAGRGRTPERRRG